MTRTATMPDTANGELELPAILTPVSDQMQAVDRVIRQRLSSDVVLINQLADYIINSGGKRLRPAVVLLAAKAAGCRGDRPVLLAAVIEFIHTATLLHDDVVDDSGRRRGRDTANVVWGNSASVLTGDFLYSRAFQMMVDLDRAGVMKVMADTTNRIAEGEVLQLMEAHNPGLDETRYLDVIDRKTASLFAAGCRLGGLIADAPYEIQAALEAYGRHLGRAFQIIDDALDYAADDSLGKNLGDDLAEGKVTLPLIRALGESDSVGAERIRRAIVDGGIHSLASIQKAIESTGALAYTCARAEREAELASEALEPLPESPSKTALAQLADFAVQRRS